MLTDHAEHFDDYWRAITRTEEFICQYGHTADPFWESRSNVDLLRAYESVQQLLEPISSQRMFHNLPNGLNAFAADNVHHALVRLLNPPERWFGQIGILDSPEYHALKRQTEEEERHVFAAGTAEHVAAGSDNFPDLNDTELEILEAMDKVPRAWPEIAQRAGYEPHTVRKYSTKLQTMGLIKRIKRGFFRTVQLPSDTESGAK